MTFLWGFSPLGRGPGEGGGARNSNLMARLPPRTAAKTTHIVNFRWENVHFQQEGSKRAPRRPKSAPRDPKTVQDRSKMA